MAQGRWNAPQALSQVAAAVNDRPSRCLQFAEQSIAGKRPIFTARAAEAYFLAASVVCIALGIPILIASLSVVEYRVPYAFEGPLSGLNSDQRQEALWGAGDSGVVYNLTVTVTKEMKAPVGAGGAH